MEIPQHIILLPPDCLQCVFLLKSSVSKKNPLTGKMEINPASIWILADNKVKRNYSCVTNRLRV